MWRAVGATEIAEVHSTCSTLYTGLYVLCVQSIIFCPGLPTGGYRLKKNHKIEEMPEISRNAQRLQRQEEQQ